MMDVDLKLSSRGLRNIPGNLYGCDFTFVVGDQNYSCDSIVAEFISPKISRMRQSDRTCYQYLVETDDQSLNFGKFLALAVDSELHVSSDDFEFFLSLSHELENEELSLQLLSAYFSAIKLTTSNAVEMLHKRQMQASDDEQEISFIARNFSEIEDLVKLDVYHLRRILSHPSLQLENEDFLYDFISSRMQKDKSYGELLEFVHFEYLSDTAMQNFIKMSPSFIFDHLNLAIWNAICGRLSQKHLIDPSSSDAQKRRFGRVIYENELSNVMAQRGPHESEVADVRRSHEERSTGLERMPQILIHAVYNENRPFDGIISYLKRQCGRNGVKITSTGDAKASCYNVTNYGWKRYWVSLNWENACLMFDFKEKRVALSGYTISSDACRTSYQLLRWVIEGSRDGSPGSWTRIDSRDTAKQDGYGFSVRHFNCDSQPNTGNSYRFIKITQQGMNNQNDYVMKLSEIEFFGLVFDK